MAKYLILFGAGASFGSASNHTPESYQTPPLGRDLYKALQDFEPSLWGKLKPQFEAHDFNFEKGWIASKQAIIDRLKNDENLSGIKRADKSKAGSDLEVAMDNLHNEYMNKLLDGNKHKLDVYIDEVTEYLKSLARFFGQFNIHHLNSYVVLVNQIMIFKQYFAPKWNEVVFATLNYDALLQQALSFYRVPWYIDFYQFDDKVEKENAIEI